MGTAGVVGVVTNIFSNGPFSWREHVWWVRADLEDPTVSDYGNVASLMQSWYTQPGTLYGVSRSDLMPSDYSLDSQTALAFLEDAVFEDYPELTILVQLLSTGTGTPLPTNVSKEIERYGGVRGSGRFGRWHTAGLTSNDVSSTDERFMDELQSHYYLDVYQTLQTVLERGDVHHPSYRLVNHHRKPWSQADDPNGWWSYVQEMGMKSLAFGTMQIRSPGHSKAHGHHHSV